MSSIQAKIANFRKEWPKASAGLQVVGCLVVVAGAIASIAAISSYIKVQSAKIGEYGKLMDQYAAEHGFSRRRSGCGGGYSIFDEHSRNLYLAQDSAVTKATFCTLGCIALGGLGIGGIAGAGDGAVRLKKALEEERLQRNIQAKGYGAVE